MAAKKTTTRPKNSLVENINRRKRAGKSRPKARSTVTPEAYEAMQEGWPKSAKRGESANSRKSSKSSKSSKKAPRKGTATRKKAP